METVNKIFESASTALWPPSQPQNEHQDIEQHGEEPLSGVQGQGTATDPYDAGNRDTQSVPVTDTPTTDVLTASGTNLPPASVTAESAPMVEQAKPERSDPNPSTGSGEEKATTTVAQADTGYEEEPEIKVSEEALKGPKTPAPRPEYQFEKEMDGKVTESQGTAGHHENVARNEDHHSHGAHLPRNISKMKDRFIGRAVKAGNHLHSTNR
ncbi:hypothetical protein PHISCL_06705 [Aspergillus sclerotialis]|uniref:Uncharacterized protein n=1 Tax=Aspergillus sclerotialis TaxID=2070753 RepID=A0A3A2ZCU1_9EURO|nr:hypothetical protein PHISCL_06705 [Aspergillus sclerotialis]